MIPEGEVGCKICEKSIYRIFVEHIHEHLNPGEFEHVATTILLKRFSPAGLRNLVKMIEEKLESGKDFS